MPSLAEPLRVQVLESIADVPRQAWDALAGDEPLPFVRWDWLNALEESGSASPDTGWEPSHLTLWRGKTLVAAVPAYRKDHSMGEYVYDFGWANAAAQLGVEYYPKLLLGAPLSPITAQRFLVLPGEDAAAHRKALAESAIGVAKETGCSSVHVIFPTGEEVQSLEESGWARRAGMQYHWRNPGYRSYEEFLSRFTSKRRHQLRRERATAAEQGISIATVRGEALTDAHARLAYRFYESTNRKMMWGRLQLNRGFFERVFRTLRPNVEVVEARKGSQVVAGAFNLTAQDKLFGRYWGCFEEYPFLHFHVCLYHSIDEAIALGRKVFEPGAGGEHKISRGFEPTEIHSAHWIFDKRLDRAVRAFVAREREELQPLFEASAEVSGMRPFTPSP